MAGVDPSLQYRLAVDASDAAVDGCLLQLKGVTPGTEASPKFLPNERRIMFLPDGKGPTQSIGCLLMGDQYG